MVLPWLLPLPQEMQSHVPKAPPPDSTPLKFSSAVEELFRAQVEKVTICRCEAEEAQEISEMVFPLHYPSTTLQEGKPLPYPFATPLEVKLEEPQSPVPEERVSFSSVVWSSVCSEQVTQAWCTKCGGFKRVVSVTGYSHLHLTRDTVFVPQCTHTHTHTRTHFQSCIN